MTDTLHLGLPFIEGSQAQKHVTHNEALRALDVLVMPAARGRGLAAPPVDPAEGDRYIVKAPGADAFAGKGEQIAVYDGDAWVFYAPRAGWTCYVEDEAALLTFDGAAWQVATGAELQNLERLGIGTTADATNPLAAKLNNALFAARTVAEGGDGDLRYKLSKESAGNTASFLFQDDFSGCAEIGLTGDDDFHVKVSPDGSNWTDALVIERASGHAKVQGLTHAATGAALGSILLTPGGDGVVSIWRTNTVSAQNPRTDTIAGVSGDVITLTSAVADAFFAERYMAGVSYIRVWNTSKSPQQSAWVMAQPAANQLRVLASADIASWTSGETLQVGDPTGITPGRVMAVDISPMLQNLFGVVFPQRGIILKSSLTATAVNDRIEVSPSGVGGSFTTTVNAHATGFSAGSGSTIIPCTMLSPVSNSNLVLVRETIATTAGTKYLNSIGVIV